MSFFSRLFHRPDYGAISSAFKRLKSVVKNRSLAGDVKADILAAISELETVVLGTRK